MSSYRDDMNDTLRVQGQPSFRSKDTATAHARFDDGVHHRIRRGVGDGLSLGDELVDRRWIKVSERGRFSDEVIGRNRTSQTVTESFRMRDGARWLASSELTDSVRFDEEIHTRLSARAGDRFKFGDSVIGTRRVRDVVIERIVIRDATFQAARDTVDDTIKVGDHLSQRMRARGQVVESLLMGEELPTDERGSVQRVTEQFALTDEAWGTLRAADTVSDDPFVVIDDARQPGDTGQAWTTATGEWAMSRFSPFTFTGIAAIDGVIYLTGPYGVFRLAGSDETITAELKTGALDMTSEVLSAPVSAYVEYELGGAAVFGVTQTQSGTVEHWEYPLNGRPVAGELTNARAVFGRGLRGRHFAYSVTMTARHGYINDWGVLFAPARRRI